MTTSTKGNRLNSQLDWDYMAYEQGTYNSLQRPYSEHMLQLRTGSTQEMTLSGIEPSTRNLQPTSYKNKKG